MSPREQVNFLLNKATPVIRIDQLGGARWRRNVAKGGRIGPWLQASYEILRPDIWALRVPCLYMLAGHDGGIRYVGISRNRLKDRWRTSPALDAETGALMPKRQLFHSQCWKRMEQEYAVNGTIAYEVRWISGDMLFEALEHLGPPLSAFTGLRGDSEGIAAAVERWICNNSSPDLAPWNIMLTGSRSRAAAA